MVYYPQVNHDLFSRERYEITISGVFALDRRLGSRLFFHIPAVYAFFFLVQFRAEG
jgi:hypothetical protein